VGDNHEHGNSAELIQHIEGLDYECWWDLPPLFNPDNHAQKAENIYPQIVSSNMLCLPAEHKIEVLNGRRVAGPEDRPFRRRPG